MISNSCKRTFLIDAGENVLAHNTVGDERIVWRYVSTMLQL